MSKLAALRASKDIEDLAKILGYSAKGLAYVAYKLNPTTRYSVFTVPKKTGGVRSIAAPTAYLKTLQRKVAWLLQSCIDEIEEASGPKQVDQASHGFRPGRSIVSNARIHRKRRYVLNLDLENFFPSINFGRVYGFLRKDKRFQLQPKVAAVMAHIACHDGRLPQGSPCSPVLSNLIGRLLDVRLVALAKKFGCIYTRYADDLTFSTNLATFPIQIAYAESPHSWQPGGELKNLITESGFAINPTKTRMQYRDSRQTVTGLVVNQKVNVRTEYRRLVKAMVHRLLTKGVFDIPGVTGKPSTLQQLNSMLGFIDWIDRLNLELYHPSPDQKTLLKKHAMYRRFLLYKEFHVAAKPVIVCEGPTDIVYLGCAIRQRAAHFPQLAEVKPDGSVEMKVRLFKLKKRSAMGNEEVPSRTAILLGLSGGGSVLASFMRTFSRETQKFSAPGGKLPIVILADNDSGASELKKVFKDCTHGPLDLSKPFSSFPPYGYLMLTPILAGGSHSQIEHFFDPVTLGTKVDGKSFSLNATINPSTEYGKTVFANKVVLPNQSTINFSGFDPILAELSNLIIGH